MKYNKVISIAFIALALTISATTIALADSSASLWKVVSGNLDPVSSSFGLRVSSLSSTGNPCVTVSSTGVFATTTCSGSGSTNVYSELLASGDLVQSGSNVTYSASDLANVPLDRTILLSRNGVILTLNDTDNGYSTSGTGASTTFTFYNCTTSDKFLIIYTY